jgi:hypothetical protein
MTKERDLLRRALEDWDFSDKFETLDPIFEEIRTYLSAEPEAEPVAWIIESELQDGSYSRWACMDRKRHEEHHDSLAPIIPLYTHPPKPAELELEEYDAGLLGYFGGGDVEWWQDYIRDLLGRAHDHYQSQVSAHPPKPAESEAEPVVYINLDEKRLEWAVPFEFKSSCFVLGKLPLYLHPPRPAEQEAEPVGYAVKMIPRGLHFIGFVGEEETEEEIEDYGPDQIVLLYTRPEPARKPMTEEEIEAACPYTDEDFMGGFFEGVRFAEKHHGITNADV